jgi:hypothetical protein
MKAAKLSKLIYLTCVLACLIVWQLPMPAQAAGWTEIRTNDQTIFITPGQWRITQWNPSSSSVIDVSKPIYNSQGKLVGYAAETREPWRFILQQAVPSGWRNPAIHDERLMAYFIPVDGSTHAVVLTHVLYRADGKTVAGVKGVCRSPRNGATYTVAFER